MKQALKRVNRHHHGSRRIIAFTDKRDIVLRRMTPPAATRGRLDRWQRNLRLVLEERPAGGQGPYSATLTGLVWRRKYSHGVWICLPSVYGRRYPALDRGSSRVEIGRPGKPFDLIWPRCAFHDWATLMALS